MVRSTSETTHAFPLDGHRFMNTCASSVSPSCGNTPAITTTFLAELRARGLLHDTTNEETLTSIPQGTPFYLGIDPTAPCIHLGNLVPMLLAMHLGKAGLKPVLLFGGATGAVGDPSGRNAERPLLSEEKIGENVAGIRDTVQRILGLQGISPEFVNNHDWTSPVSLLSFLRDIGKYVTVNYMLAKDSVKSRLGGDGLSFTEFSYMLLQGFDFWHLRKHHGVRLQIGGADQWGNITTGLEIIRKKEGEHDCVAMSVPLLLDSAGKKFGKSSGGGSLWLSPALTSPYALHQYLLNTADQDVERYLKLFLLQPLPEIEAVIDRHRSNPEQRIGQRALADGVVALVHGQGAVAEAQRAGEVLFGGSLEGIPPTVLREIFREVPSSTISRTELGALPIVDVLVRVQLAPSKSEARRLIQGGGIYAQNSRIVDGAAPFSATLIADEFIILRSGKKRYHLIEISSEQ
jgi:tyrosyl-tRNA synthetase